MQYEDVQAQVATICSMAALIVLVMVVVRRGVVAPLVAFAATVLLMRAVGFLGSYLGSEGAAPITWQVIIDHVRYVPSLLLVTYVCLMQARRYRFVRNNDKLRVWFLWAPYILGAVYLYSFVGDLVVQAPTLDSSQDQPVASLFTGGATRNTVTAIFAALASFVFLLAARPRSGPLNLNQRLQNLFFGIALGATSGLSLYAVLRRALRALSPEALTGVFPEVLLAIEYALFVLFAGGIVLGVLCYYVRSRKGRFVERFLSFLDLAGDLAEELARAPVADGKLSRPYATMRQAASGEFLNLSPADKRRMDNAFRARAVLENKARRRVNRRRLTDLSRAYDVELREPVLSKGLSGGACGDALPGTLKDLLRPRGYGSLALTEAGGREGLGEVVALALKTADADGEPDLSSAAEWEQLVHVALADAGLLPARRGQTILGGRGVSEKVLDTYDLARYKLHTARWDDAGG